MNLGHIRNEKGLFSDEIGLFHGEMRHLYDESDTFKINCYIENG